MMRFYRYPWRASFGNLAEELAHGFPVASGACCIVPAGSTFKYPFPASPLYIDGQLCTSFELPDTDNSGRISLYSYGEQQLRAAKGAYPGLFLERNQAGSDLSELIFESLRYIQRLEDIIDAQPAGQQDAIPRIDWSLALSALRETDWAGEIVRKPLIVDLAENQQFPLKEIARGAKRVLRRRRDTERLSKAREFDKATLIRIAQLPGRTISEKAGPKQRIPAVTRFETTDTLENRVVEHFCRLAEIEWRRNDKLSAEHQRLATGFVGLCKRVKRSEDFSGIRKLTSPCNAPNFTLEQNNNYRAVWQGYRKLIQHQSEQEECWAWARRVFLNRAYVYIAELYQQLFPSSETLHIPYHKHLRARPSHHFGLWLESSSLPGPRVIRTPNKELQTAYLLSPQDVQVGFTRGAEVLRLNADAYIALVAKEQISVCPTYAFVGNSEQSACRDAKKDLAETFARIRSAWNPAATGVRLTKPLFLWSDFLGDRGLEDTQSDGILQAGIPVHNDPWSSPDSQIVEAIRLEFMR